MHLGACYREPAEVGAHGSRRSRDPIQKSRSAKLELAGVDKDIENPSTDFDAVPSARCEKDRAEPRCCTAHYALQDLSAVHLAR